MDKIKAVFFDVDGTLLSHRTVMVPDSTIEAIRIMQSNGIKCVMSSGRHPNEIDRLHLENIDFDAYVTANGQIVLDKDRNVIAARPFSEKETEILVSGFEEKRIPLLLSSINDMYVNYIDDEVRKILEEIHTPEPRVDSYKGEKLYQAVAYVGGKNPEWIEELKKKFHVTFWNENGADIVSKEANKAIGISDYIDLMGIKRSETMGFGDGENDKEMLEYTGIGVAMGNSADELKRIADYITDDIDEDGLYNACKHFGLL